MRYLAGFLFCALIPSLAIARDYRRTKEQPLEIEQIGLTMAVGVGYGRPLGHSYRSTSTLRDTSLDSVIAAQVPVVFGLGLRPSPYLSFGVVLQYVPLVTRNCDAGATCSARDTYVGGEMRLHLLPGRLVCPWISFGLGYEWLSLSETGTVNAEGGFAGQNYDIGLGADIRVTRSFAVGPYVGGRFGKYGTVDDSSFASIPEQSQRTHGWWVIGVRGVFTISQP